jgi:hypothetical protein
LHFLRNLHTQKPFVQYNPARASSTIAKTSDDGWTAMPTPPSLRLTSEPVARAATVSICLRACVAGLIHTLTDIFFAEGHLLPIGDTWRDSNVHHDSIYFSSSPPQQLAVLLVTAGNIFWLQR